MYYRLIKGLLLIFLFPLFQSCAGKQPAKALTIKDLDLTYVFRIRSEIADNKIKREYAISDNYKKPEKQRTWAYSEYDILGRRIVDYSYPPYTDTKTWFYDSFGFLKGMKDEYYETKNYVVNYRFDTTLNLLVHYWSGNRKDTCLFYFNHTGALIKSVVCTDIWNGAFRYVDFYSYNAKKKLDSKLSIQIETFQDTAIFSKSPDSVNTIWMQYYYTGERLDSTIESFKFSSGSRFKKLEVYDKNGLPISDVHTDGNMNWYKYEKR